MDRLKPTRSPKAFCPGSHDRCRTMASTILRFSSLQAYGPKQLRGSGVATFAQNRSLFGQLRAGAANGSLDSRLSNFRTQESNRQETFDSEKQPAVRLCSTAQYLRIYSAPVVSLMCLFAGMEKLNLDLLSHWANQPLYRTLASDRTHLSKRREAMRRTSFPTSTKHYYPQQLTF